MTLFADFFPEMQSKEFDRHDEIGFEFLGNISVQTNVFVNSQGNKEQHHIMLAFLSWNNFHKYSVL